SAEEDARLNLPAASSSITPGASGGSAGAAHASAIRPRRTVRANKAEAAASSSTSRSSNSCCPARRTRISAPQVGPPEDDGVHPRRGAYELRLRAASPVLTRGPRRGVWAHESERLTV